MKYTKRRVSQSSHPGKTSMLRNVIRTRSYSDMTRGHSKIEDEDTQEILRNEAPEPTRRDRRKGSSIFGRLQSPETLSLVLALVSLVVLVLLRGNSTVPVLPFLASFTLFLIPGFLLSYLITVSNFSRIGRAPLAFVLSTGVFGFTAIPFLFLNRGFSEYLLACAALLIISLVFAAYRLLVGKPLRDLEWGPSWNLTDLLWVPFVCLTGVLAYVSTVIQEEPNGDSWIYLAYVRDYTNSDNLAVGNPFLGGQATDSYLSFRTMTNGWLMEQAAFSRVSGLAPVELVFEYLAPALVVLSLLAVYALTKTLLGKGPALLAGSLTALFFLLDLQSTIPVAFLSPGNDFVARITEDKYVARFLFLPVSLSLAILYLKERKIRYLALFAFICWSVAVVHPIGLILIGISVAGLGFFHLLANLRQSGSWKAVLSLGAAVASISIPPLVYLVATGSPLLSRLTESSTTESLIQTWVSSKRLLVIGGDSYIMHPSLLLNPAVLAAYALSVSFVIFRYQRDFAAQLLLGVLFFTPLLIYVPFISTPLANIVGPWVLVRLSWPIALAAPLVIGWVTWEVLQYLGSRLQNTGIGTLRYAKAALPILLIVALVAATSPMTLAAVRSADESGETAIGQSSCFDPVFPWMQENITEPSTVLAPYQENSCIPAYDSDSNVINLRGVSRSNRSEQELFRFYGSFTVNALDEQFLRREEVGYVLVSANSPLEAQLGHLPGFTALDSPGERYKLYSVDQDSLLETASVTANTLMQDGDFNSAGSYYIMALSGDTNEQFLGYMGLGMLNANQDLYADAAANYEQALQLDRTPSLYPLLSDAYNSANEPELARLALENAVARYPENVALRSELSGLLASQDPAAAVEVQRKVVEMYPEIPGYRIQLGYYLALNDLADEADRQFERAISKDPLSPQIHSDVGLANQVSGREKAAVRHYERALELNPVFGEARDRLKELRG